MDKEWESSIFILTFFTVQNVTHKLCRFTHAEDLEEDESGISCVLQQTFSLRSKMCFYEHYFYSSYWKEVP